MKEQSKNTYTQVPFKWSEREDVSLPMKVIVAYIYTRANIEKFEWELVAADIAVSWGLPKSTVSKVLKELEGRGVIKVVGWKRTGGDFPSKVYRIDRAELKKLMTPSTTAVHTVNCHGSSCEPPRFNRRTATVSVMNLQEDSNKKIDKKISEEEEKSEIPPIFNSASGSTPPRKSFDELFEDIFGAVASGKNKTQDLSESAAFPSENPTETPMATDTKEETNDSSACPAANADNNNHPIPSARPEKLGELPVLTPPRRSAVDELLSLPPKEQLKWLDAVEANESMVPNLRAGKDVPMTEVFKDYFANM